MNEDKKDIITITDLGIVEKYDEQKKQIVEIPFNTFIKNIKSNVNNDLNSIDYDKENNKFYLIEKNNGNKKYELNINDDVMKKYKQGDFNKSTYELNNLLLISRQKNKLEKINNQKEQETTAIAIKANNNISDLSPIEARQYLDHLKKEDKSHTKNIAKSSAKFGVAAGIPIAAGVTVGAICFAPGVAFAYTMLAATLGTTMGGLVEGWVTMYINDSPGMDMFPVTTCKNLIKDIKDHRKKLNINKTKEKELKKIKYVDKLVEPKSVVIEESPLEELDLSDHIMNEINNMVDRAAYINTEDRTVMLTELKELLNEYQERKTSIINGDTSINKTDNLVALRNDVCKDLAKIELKLNDTKVKDSKKKVINDEAKQLSGKIDKVNNMDPEVLEQRKKEIQIMLQDEDNNNFEDLYKPMAK